MKRIGFVVAFLVLVIASCSPSPEAIQKAIEQTQAAYTSTPTLTPTVTNTPTLTYTPTATFTVTPSPTPRFDIWNVQQVQDAIVSAGLEFSNPTSMTKEDYGLAPMSAIEGIHFFLPSLCSDCGGRLYSFANLEDLSLMERYYTELGRQSAMFFSWVFVKDNILIQMNGDLSEENAIKYNEVLTGLE